VVGDETRGAEGCSLRTTLTSSPKRRGRPSSPGDVQEGTVTLEIGQAAPDFTLKNQHGESISLHDYAGRQHVVVVFYPFAFSGVCTGELGEIRDSIVDFTEADSVVLALSCDSMFALRVFGEREGLEFHLLSDFWPHGEVARAYGVFDEQLGCSGRATFIVDRSGVLRWYVENEIPQARNLHDYRKVLRSLG
jgi:mycoredoxin-dependent peroxiredoxin